MRTTTFGVIIGNRGFFPDQLARDGREKTLRVLEQQAYSAICLTPKDTKFGSVETLQDARKCADLFKQHVRDIDGILVSLPNFGDEKSVANVIRMSELDVPVLIHAFPDEADLMHVAARRDSFCGKISVCNNLWQYGIRYTLTRLHSVSPATDSFKSDLRFFAATCRIVKGLKNVRVGVLGARPTAFNTVRFSEKLMERAGISVETLDLSEVFGRIGRMLDDDLKVQNKLSGIQEYVTVRGVPTSAVLKMAKFAVVVDDWMRANELVGSSIQCWTAMEEYFGIVPCTVMSVMSKGLLPSACETDIAGLIGMYVLQLASGEPSAIVDWNNNYDNDPNKAVVFHCSNFPNSLLEQPRMDFQEILAGTVGKENAFGTVSGRLKSGPLTFCRVSSDDFQGGLRAYVGEGEFTSDPLHTFGGFGVVKIPRLQNLLRYVCRRGFEHHVAINRSYCGRAIAEALSNYRGWEVYHHLSSVSDEGLSPGIE